METPRKLSLNLAELRLKSFETTPTTQDSSGTVHGMECASCSLCTGCSNCTDGTCSACTGCTTYTEISPCGVCTNSCWYASDGYTGCDHVFWNTNNGGASTTDGGGC